MSTLGRHPPDPRPASPIVRASPRRYTAVPAAVDVQAWSRSIDRLRAQHPRSDWSPDRDFLERATYGSFRLDGISLSPGDVHASLARDNKHRGFRSRIGHRLRNHAAILLSIERDLARRSPLKQSTVLRWYTGLSCGLSHTMPAEPKLERIESVVRRVNSPHMRLSAALADIVELQVELQQDALVPSFSGLLNRLLLHYQLGRCGLRPVTFDPDRDAGTFATNATGLGRLMELIEHAYEAL
jgi:hypothetical protein